MSRGLRSGFYARSHLLTWMEAEAREPECSAAWDVYWKGTEIAEIELRVVSAYPHAIGVGMTITKWSVSERDFLMATLPEMTLQWPPLPIWFFYNGLWRTFAGAN